jgi:4-carboxymuconolactone decarboxylase
MLARRTFADMRLRHLTPAELDADQRAVYDELTKGSRQQITRTVPMAVRMIDDDGRLLGPFNAFLHHPHLGMALQEVSRRLRFEGVLTTRQREIVILLVAASQRSPYEWGAHVPIAIDAGLDPEVVDAIARGGAATFADPAEQAAADLAASLIATGDAAEALFERARESLGDKGIVEVSTTVGVYQLLAQQMRLLRVPGPPTPWDGEEGGAA